MENDVLRDGETGKGKKGGRGRRVGSMPLNLAVQVAASGPDSVQSRIEYSRLRSLICTPRTVGTLVSRGEIPQNNSYHPHDCRNIEGSTHAALYDLTSKELVQTKCCYLPSNTNGPAELSGNTLKRKVRFNGWGKKFRH